MAILAKCTLGQEPYPNLSERLVKFMIFGGNQTNNLALASTSANVQAMAILVAIVIPIFKLGREIDKSNAYMKFGRNQVSIHKCIPGTYRQRPFWQRSWRSFVGQNQF